jgi:threonine aldolase
VSVENTHNFAGGAVQPLEDLQALRTWATSAGTRIHVDGARIWNAHVATGTSLADYGAVADVLAVCLSKGLGAPVGSILAGSGEAMERAWRVRRRLGGGMRQAGIVAAAGLYALRHNLERLEEDHRRADALARGCAAAPGVVAPKPQTNIVMLDLEDEALQPDALLAGMRERGVWMTQFGPRRLRAVLHMDVDDAGVQRAVAAFRDAVAGLAA